MTHPTSMRRAFAAAAALAAVGALALAVSGCTSASGSVRAPEAAAPAAAANAPVATASETAARAATSAAAAETTASSSASPTKAEGAQVIQTYCMGKCHGSSLLNGHYRPSKAYAIAQQMGRVAHLDATQKAAVLAYYAQ